MERAFDPDWLLAECDPGEGFRVGSGELDSGSSRFHPHATEGFEGSARIDNFGESCKSRLQLAGWNADSVGHWFWFSLDAPKAVEIALHGLPAGCCWFLDFP
jgi:hypothetical protein